MIEIPEIMKPALSYVGDSDLTSALTYLDSIEGLIKKGNTTELSLSNFFLCKGLILSSVPTMETEALDAFCHYNVHQFIPNKDKVSPNNDSLKI